MNFYIVDINGNVSSLFLIKINDYIGFRLSAVNILKLDTKVDINFINKFSDLTITT